jgi:hypothetical protein
LQKLLCYQGERSSEEWLQLLQNVERTYHLEWHRLAHATQTEQRGASAAPVHDDSNVELF